MKIFVRTGMYESSCIRVTSRSAPPTVYCVTTLHVLYCTVLYSILRSIVYLQVDKNMLSYYSRFDFCLRGVSCAETKQAKAKLFGTNFNRFDIT